MKDRMHVFSIGGVLFGIVIFFFFSTFYIHGMLNGVFGESKIRPIESDVQDFQKELEKWRMQIRQGDSREVYQKFVHDNAARKLSARHGMAHVFGAALYLELGIEGIQICDDRFAYGCFHELLGRAISEHGFSILTELNSVCMKHRSSSLVCQHGLGHGILTEIGYTFDDLARSLSTCDTLEGIDAIGGCYTGVFMEYNLRTMLGEAIVVRDINEDNPYEPCSEVAERYKYACVYRLPQWWHAALFREEAGTLEPFSQLGDMCDAFEHSDAAQVCFGGIGHVAASVMGFEPERIINACDAAADTAQGQLYCQALAANRLSNESTAPDPSRTCENLGGNHSALCNIWAQRNRTALCGSVPRVFRGLCERGQSGGS